MNYLGWQDDSKRTVSEKIAAGKAAYHERFGYPPAVVLVNEDEACAVEGMLVLVKPWMRKGNFFFGQSDC